MTGIIITLSTNLFRVYITYRFMCLFFEEKSAKKSRELIFYGLFYILTSGVYLLFHFMLLNMITNLVMIYAVASCYEGKWKKKLFVTLLIYGISVACDFVGVHILENYSISKSHPEQAVYISVFLVTICEFLLERRLKKHKEKTEIPHWNILIIICGVSIVQLNILLLSRIQNKYFSILLSISVLFVDLLIFYLYEVLMKAYRKLEERAELEKQNLIYANQLEVLTKSEERTKSVRHDMKNHLAVLANLAQQWQCEEVTAYICQIWEYMKNPEERVKSGNKNLDSLLNYFLSKAAQCLKQVEYQGQVPEKMNVLAFDMNVILGNLMDNAIEAAVDSEEKFLAVRLNYVKGILVIEVENSFQHELWKENGRYLTTKQGVNHGIGLNNVQKMVEKYHGAMEIEEKDGVFQVCVELFVNE